MLNLKITGLAIKHKTTISNLKRIEILKKTKQNKILVAKIKVRKRLYSITRRSHYLLIDKLRPSGPALPGDIDKPSYKERRFLYLIFKKNCRRESGYSLLIPFRLEHKTF